MGRRIDRRAGNRMKYEMIVLEGQLRCFVCAAVMWSKMLIKVIHFG
jgi:hypothetical protein